MKKKTFFTLAALCMAVAANATILRVSNVNGSSAPYSTIQAAVDAATAGDTIMVDGSSDGYGYAEISKSLVLIGPGYWLNKNGLVQESAPSAQAYFLILSSAPGTVIEGFELRGFSGGLIRINADNCVIRRNSFYDHVGYNAISFSRDYINDEYIGPDPSGAVIQQNFFHDCKITAWRLNGLMSNAQITNNIFLNNEGEYSLENIGNSYIAYNTIVGECSWSSFRTVLASTIEHNIIREQKVSYENIGIQDDNEWSDNKVVGSFKVEFNTEKEIRDNVTAEIVNTHGAFAGDSPYVLSGIPAAPVIQDLVMPTTVEKGKKMNVTIKVGVQK